MIQIKVRGHYKLLRPKNGKNVLIFDEKDNFLWNKERDVGELTIADTDYVLKDNYIEGNYRQYSVKSEQVYTDGLHLEFQTGCGCWESYLLPKGLPNKTDVSTKILTTSEKITVTNNCCSHCSHS